MDDKPEPEILSYREFVRRQTLLAWERRSRAHQHERPPLRGKIHERFDVARTEQGDRAG